LGVKISWLTLGVDKVAINPRLVNSVEFPLVFEQIRLP
jgi:hypothetical protein